MAFAAGMHVFPGGSVDPRDAEHVDGLVGPQRGRVGARWAATHRWPGRSCAPPSARRSRSPGCCSRATSRRAVVADTTGADWERDRPGTARPVACPWPSCSSRRGLVLRSDLLRPWAHWITPEFEPRRFDTRFFVAAVPTGQRTRDVERRGRPARSGCRWPTRWRGIEAGRLPMLPPTIVALRELAAYGSVAEVLAADMTVTPLMPRAVVERRRGAAGGGRPDGLAAWTLSCGYCVSAGRWRRCPPGAALVRADNPGPMTLDGTNTYVLRARRGAPVRSWSTPGRSTRRISQPWPRRRARGARSCSPTATPTTPRAPSCCTR